MNEHQALQRFFYFIEFFKDWILGIEREKINIRYKEGNKRWKSNVSYFLLLEAFSFAASILKYSSTSSTRVSSFFLVSLGVLFWAGSLQGSESLSSSRFGFEKGIGGFVTP